MESSAALCPQHPTISSFFDAAEYDYSIDGRQTKQFIRDASYLVSSEARPETWETYKSKVTDCYWEISDASGNILLNLILTIAPRFTVVVPADAAEFTAEGCSFRWVSE